MGAPVDNDTRRDDLWKLYRSALEEVRFQVTLNWDRTKHYFLFNGVLFGAAGGLSHLGGRSWVPQLILFFLAALNSLFAAHAIRRGHEYYRETRRHLKAVEKALGLTADEAMNTTRGMARETFNNQSSAKKDRFTITYFAIRFQLAMAVGAVIAFVWVLVTRVGG